jgi:SAM-dependent methyltransferase
VDDRPAYDADFISMREARGPLGERLAELALRTCGPWLPRPVSELEVLDAGSGYGATVMALARRCARATGLEPSRTLHEHAAREAAEAGRPNLLLRHGRIEDLDDVEAYDLVVLDNVLEHIPDQPRALERLVRALRPGGVIFIVVPNRLWPIEAHYRLPFLSWLPLPLANVYLRATGRGRDYSDASHAPTLWRLRALLRGLPELAPHFVVPEDLSATMTGAAWHYRLGAAMLRRVPALWAVAKAFVVTAVKAGSRAPPANGG